MPNQDKIVKPRSRDLSDALACLWFPIPRSTNLHPVAGHGQSPQLEMVRRSGGEPVLGRLLVVGDVHLGRRPLRLPPDCADADRFGPEAAFDRCIELAVTMEVAALVLAGDVVESLEDRFEATRVLAAGLERLQQHGIPLVAVAGNHDVRALPRVARLHGSQGFHILGCGGLDGADGGWQAMRIHQDGRSICQLLGWSFHHVREGHSPLASLPVDLLDDDLANLGVLHCDRDAPGSPYAPVTSTEFSRGAAARCDAWFLGHIHRPDHAGLDAARPVGYLGSLVGLDPGEPGRHGPWLVEIRGRGRVRAEQLAVAPLRFEPLRLALEEFAETEPTAIEDALFAAIGGRLRELHDCLGDDVEMLQAVGVRLQVDGTARCPAGVRRALQTLQGRGLYKDLGAAATRVRYFCEQLVVEVKPMVSLAELASERSAVGILARKLLQFEADREALLGPLGERIAEIRPGFGWPEQIDASQPPPDLAALFEATAFELIAELREQQTQASSTGGGAVS